MASRRSARLNPAEQAQRAIVQSLNMLVDGKSDAFGTVTLTVNAASTTVTNANVSESTHIHFTPLNANAASEIGAGTMYVSARNDGAFTITHANNANTRAFSYGWNG